jgi:uncharacterized membrane protein YozB (DUF420 family)
MVVALFHSSGFLGTNANLAADATLLISIVVAILFTVGMILARRGKYGVHRWVQTTAASLNLVLVLWMMALPFRDTIRDFGAPPRMAGFYFVPLIHGMIGFSGLLFGLFVVLRANGLMIRPLRFNDYKTFMRISYGLYMLATLAGIGVYLMWFVVEPHPPVY